MIRISKHGKKRIVERTDGIDSISEAKKTAKLAFNSGKTINHFQRYPKFFNYLQNKRDQSNGCRIRVYRGNIYIWKGKTKILVTAHGIPNEYIIEMNGG